MERIHIESNLDPIKKDEIIKLAHTFNAKVYYHGKHGIYIECADRKNAKKIAKELEKLKMNEKESPT